MAASATTIAAAYISTQNFSSSKNYYSSSVSCSFSPFSSTKKLLFSIKNSTSDVTTTTENREDGFSDDGDDKTIEVTKESSSLISALNAEKALRGMAITDVDHYGRLGLPRQCSYDQVTIAYNKKVEEIENEGLDEEELNKQRELLKESYSILSLPEERRLYDWSLARVKNGDKYIWPYQVDSSKKSTETPPQAEPEDEGPTRATGYFILAWFMLSLVLLVAFNR